MRTRSARLHLIALAALAFARPAAAADPPADSLHQLLEKLTREGKFSGAVVIRGEEGVRFARGYGPADPFSGRRYTPETPADSASVAKPMTAAAVLMLARDGKIDLDAPVRGYVAEYPHPLTTVRQLLAHSAGLAIEESAETLAGKSNSTLIIEAGKGSPQPSFPPGSAFEYCNLCTIALAILIERVTGRHYLQILRDRLRLPDDVRLRPPKLSDWTGRAIGYRRGREGKIHRFDSWEGEAFYGSGNLSISASQLARWGAEWWQAPLASLRPAATATAMIAGKEAGLTIGNWFCAEGRRRCHYGGHHEGFHHMYYWDADRRISLAMMTNNTLDPALHQRLQRSLVAFAEGRERDAGRELATPMSDLPVPAGIYLLPNGKSVTVSEADQPIGRVEYGGISYQAYRVAKGIRYVPGLDVYLSGTSKGAIHWLTLHEDLIARPK